MLQMLSTNEHRVKIVMMLLGDVGAWTGGEKGEFWPLMKKTNALVNIEYVA